MTYPLNPNGKRSTYYLIDRQTDYHRLPFDPLINNATKKPRTLLHHPPISQLSINSNSNNSTTATNTTTSTATTHTTTATTNTTTSNVAHKSPSITAINTNSNTLSTFINPITAHKKHNNDLPISQRSAINKTLSALVFPHPNQSNTPLDLLNPKATSAIASPTKKPTQPQRPTQNHLLTATSRCNLENQNPLHLDPNRDSRLISKEKQRPKEKDDLKREMAQWQEKYRMAIKNFVFYLDRLDQPTTLDLTSKIRAWGARVDPFFSKDVTHLITDQPVPIGIHEQAPSPRKRNNAYQLPSPTRNKENGQPIVGPCRISKRLTGCSPGKDFSNDMTLSSHQLILKCLELKIKIWKSEKLLNVLYRLGDQRSPIKQPPIKPSLPSLLLKEAQQGHTNEYDPVAPKPDYYYFGPKAMFIMVEDSNQEHKPIIVKEYARPKTREATAWPVMWGGAEGKSAFSRNSAKQSYLQIRNRIRQSFEMRSKAMLQQGAPQPNAETPQKPTKSPDKSIAAPQHVERDPPVQPTLRRAVSMNILQRRQSARLTRNSIYSKPCESVASKSDDNVCKEIDHVNATTPQYHRGPGNVFLAASGNSMTVTSNMPSATSIRSTALRPGTQANRHLVDKRLAALGKRPTFEIHHQADSTINQVSSKMNAVVGTAEPSKNRLQTLRKELNQNISTLTGGNLKRSQSLDSSLIAKKKAQDSQLAQKSKRKGLGVRAKLGNGFDLLDLRRLARPDEPKAGYCENCRLKYVDFKKHVLSRKHRKFALDEENWAELDYMLKRATRKLKPGVSVPPSVREMILSTQNDEQSDLEEEEAWEEEDESVGEEEEYYEEEEQEEEIVETWEKPKLKLLDTVDSELTHSCVHP